VNESTRRSILDDLTAVEFRRGERAKKARRELAKEERRLLALIWNAYDHGITSEAIAASLSRGDELGQMLSLDEPDDSSTGFSGPWNPCRIDAILRETMNHTEQLVRELAERE
jgi:hypothetical protein